MRLPSYKSNCSVACVGCKISLMKVPLCLNNSCIHKKCVWESMSRLSSVLHMDLACRLSVTQSAVRQHVMNYPPLILPSSHDLHAHLKSLKRWYLILFCTPARLRNLISLKWSVKKRQKCTCWSGDRMCRTSCPCFLAEPALTYSITTQCPRLRWIVHHIHNGLFTIVLTLL